MNTKPKVLVVDDEPQLREVLKALLKEKYDVLLASDGTEGVRLAKEHLPDAIIMDVVMVPTDGLSACEMIQSDPTTCRIPVLMLTAVNSVNERIRAFKAGAVDYISKPFYPEELFVRLDSKIKLGIAAPRVETAGDATRCGNLTLDPRSLEVRVDGREVSLTLLEFNLLHYFVESKGTLRSREQILEAVWRSKEVPGRILDPHILALRRKLEGFDHKLATIYGGGYILKKQDE